MEKSHICSKLEFHLASYAVKCSIDLPHEYPQEHPKFRSFFQQDKDRVLHSESFRRLGYKTQVFVVYEGDFYRTRLTHSLEVAQVSRSLAVAFSANEDLVEAVAYAHDLGHPPFGHRGEDTLNSLFQQALADKFGIKAPANRKAFEQNYQSYRIVSELEKRYFEFPGLNLSIPVLKALLRHETAFDIPSIPYPIELVSEEKTKKVKQLYFDTKSPSLEAQIVNVADQIAWVTHDLEDALRVRFLHIEDLRKLNNRLLNLSEERIKKGSSWEKDTILWGRLLVRNMIDILITDLVNENAQKLSKHKSSKEIEQIEFPILRFSSEIEKAVENLRNFLLERVYTHPIAERMSSKASMILERTFEKLVKDIESEKSTSMKLLPYSTQEILRSETNPVKRVQIVVDFIAGMTDRFASEFYRILFEPEERGITSLY
ncbi:MAG: dNTP triphosphohydrolase [Thermoanaerobaculaceae bacterium]|nr:dNTP triphosphohydrolase [Thermoanaerobaculaceae bacterium]